MKYLLGLQNRLKVIEKSDSSIGNSHPNTFPMEVLYFPIDHVVDLLCRLGSSKKLTLPSGIGIEKFPIDLHYDL